MEGPDEASPTVTAGGASALVREDGTIIENVASVLSAGVESDQTNNTDTASVTVGPLPFTGFGLSRIIVLAAELLLLGALLLVASRRRRSVVR